MTSDSRAILYELQDAVVEAQSAEGDRGVAILAEAFDRLRGMLAREDRGWVRLYGDDEDQLFGLTLEDLKNWGRKIGEAVPGAPLVGAGFRRRRDFIWQGGIRYGNLPDGGSQGVRKLKTITQTDTNKLHFYGKSARHRREHRLFTSGIALWKGNDHTKELEAIPLRQITGQFLDPEGLGLVWAYLREWSMVDVRSGRRREYKRWYFTDRFKSKRVLNIATPDGVKIPVDQDHVIFDQHANSTDGLVYGSPDGLAGFIWAGIARDAYMDGISMTEALARFALKATASSKKGAENAAMQYANGNTAGGMAIVGGANGLDAMSSAGKAYEFSQLRPLIAMAATAFDIPALALTLDSEGGGSYAAASTLDLPSRLAMTTRREEHIELDSRVLKWLGMTEEPDIQFEPYEADDEIYRSIQGFMLGFQNNLYSFDEAREFLDNLFGFPNGKAPTGAARPFGDLAAKNNAGALPQTASPAQGRSNGTGGQKGGSASNDLRTDKVTK